MQIDIETAERQTRETKIRYRRLMERLSTIKRPDREVDVEMAALIGRKKVEQREDGEWYADGKVIPRYTAFREAALALWWECFPADWDEPPEEADAIEICWWNAQETEY
ncbi:hypothetical protein [Rhizobium sp. LC145]|uniref:hypothetical protein n=1 Tax=Rhizobium sp. LC145 TaxID=1120688 RepID=UPI00062A3E26|nr:hypothetical protein [Rhizobium sp. LC145]KKX28216.1 hypothetical protein YH62_19180 [Rhizobium sp. LC145]TKT42537.1 hypothetical protein FDR95_28945 [Rhizobiaceae bacterium LC148]